MANSNAIPKKFLDQILSELRNAGLVFSKKGKGGGYALARPAHRNQSRPDCPGARWTFGANPVRQHHRLPPLRRLRRRKSLRGAPDHGQGPQRHRSRARQPHSCRHARDGRPGGNDGDVSYLAGRNPAPAMGATRHSLLSTLRAASAIGRRPCQRPSHFPRGQSGRRHFRLSRAPWRRSENDGATLGISHPMEAPGKSFAVTANAST